MTSGQKLYNLYSLYIHNPSSNGSRQVRGVLYTVDKIKQKSTLEIIIREPNSLNMRSKNV